VEKVVLNYLFVFSDIMGTAYTAGASEQGVEENTWT
jgi:hypothetical protein